MRFRHGSVERSAKDKLYLNIKEPVLYEGETRPALLFSFCEAVDEWLGGQKDVEKNID